MGVPADVALRQEQLRVGVLVDELGQMLADVLEVGLALDVRPHEIQRGQQHHVDALLLHVPAHQMGGQQFALRQDHLLLDRAEQLLGEGSQEDERVVDEGLRLLRVLLGGVQFLDDFQVLTLEAADGVPGPLGVVVVQIAGNLHERVRGA